MCGLYDSNHFWDSPTQCQVAAIAAWQGPMIVSADQPNNPARVANLADSPLLNLSFSNDGSDKMMSFALSSTKKKKKTYIDIGDVGSVTVRDDRGPSIDLSSTPGDDASTDPFKKFRSSEKLSDVDCDNHLSEIFGGVAKAMEGSGDIDGLNRVSQGGGHSATPTDPLIKINGRMVRNTDAGGIIHTYTDETASSSTDTALFTPGGWIGSAVPYLDKLGNSGLIFNYSGGLTIEFVHAGTSNPNGIPSVPKNPGAGNLARIGYVGGAGGEGGPHRIWQNGKITDKSTSGYYHTHIVFFSNKPKNIRTDPRKIFCGW